MSGVSMRPLEGITVIALEHAIAAPLCTRQLADLGARVIKVERPGAGDFARAYDDRVRGLSSHFVWTNRGKESVALDLKHPAAREVLLEAAVVAGLDAGEAAAVIDDTACFADEVREAESGWQQAGIRSVPSVVIDRRFLVAGGQPPEVFEDALRRRLAASD